MRNNLFYTHVKEQMVNSRPDVPPHIWDNIMAKKDRKQPLGFWFNNSTKGLMGLLIFTGIGVALYFNSNKTTLITPVNNGTETNNIAPIPNNKNIIENDKTAPSSPLYALINPLEDEKNNKQINSALILNKTQSIYKANQLYRSTDNELFIALENNTQISIASNNTEKTFKRQIPNTSLLKIGFFNPQLQLRKFPKSPFIPCPEVEKNAAGSKRYIEVYGGPDYVFRSFSDTANSAYLQQRKASVKYLFAYSAGIRYTRVFGSGMSFRTGLNYSQINEQFTSEKGRIIQNVYIINSNGDTTGTFLQSGTLYKTSTNKYKNIDVPISVGYEAGNGRIHSNINIGAVINIHSSQKGFVLDKNGTAVDISSNKSSSVYQYKTKAGVSFIGAASIYYKLNESVHLMAEPYIKLSLSPATKPEISLKEKFHTAGIRLGMRMDF